MYKTQTCVPMDTILPYSVTKKGPLTNVHAPISLFHLMIHLNCLYMDTTTPAFCHLEL